MPCTFVSGPLRRLLDQGTSRRDLSLRDFAASGPRADARLVWPPARRGIRTAAPGSCAELRLQDTALLISGAGTGEHIARPASSSACIDHETRNLIPGAEIRGSAPAGTSRAQ